MGAVWVIGGLFDASNYLSCHGHVEIFEEWKWTEGPTYPEQVDAARAVAISDYEIMVCGGFSPVFWNYHSRCYKVVTINCVIE